MRYAEYLRTEHWQEARQQAITYYKWHETPADLLVLCERCHAQYHGIATPKVVYEDTDFWPVVHMSDGTIRKGPRAEIVGRL